MGEKFQDAVKVPPLIVLANGVDVKSLGSLYTEMGDDDVITVLEPFGGGDRKGSIVRAINGSSSKQETLGRKIEE